MAPHAPSEERGEDVVHPHATEDIAKIDVSLAAHALGSAEPIIVGALLLIGEDRIGLVQLLELLFGVRIVRNIRVHLARLLEKRPLYGSLVGIAIDTQHLVVIFEPGTLETFPP